MEGTLRWLAWVVLVSAAALYLPAHSGVLRAPIPGQPEWPLFPLPAPHGGWAPWLVLAGALAGGLLLARRTGAAHRVPALALGAYAVLVVPAHCVGLLAWVSGRPLFGPGPWAFAVWLSVAALAAWAWRRRPVSPNPPPPRPRDPLTPWLVLVALAVAGVQAHALARTLRHGARAWDGESYHLPVALQWLHTGSLTEPLVRMAAISRAEIDRFANPGNGHLVMALPLSVGWDFLAWTAQLPFLALAAWAVRRLARGAGASPGAGALAVLAFLSAPIVADQAAVPMLDLATAALSLSALALLLEPAGEDRVPATAVALSGLALGLALGTKTTAIAQGGLVAALIVASRWAWRAPAKERARAAAVFLGLLVLPSTFWYARSAVLLGNPIHPIELRILGVAVFPGTTAEDMSGTWDVQRMQMGSRWQWLLFPFRDPEYSDETGFGALLVALGTLGLLAAAVDLARTARERRLTPGRRLALVAGLALVVFWFAAARTPRFNLPLLGLLAALGARAVDDLGSGVWRHATGALVAVCAAVTFSLSLRYHGWEVGPPYARVDLLETDYPGIPVGIDTLPPQVIFNDTRDDAGSRPSNYKLFGRDHRHLVYDHPQLVGDASEAFLAGLHRLGVTAVFFRTRKDRPAPPRYRTDALEPMLRFEGRDFRSTLYRVR